MTARASQAAPQAIVATPNTSTSRPLPTEQLQPREVLLFGVATIACGAAWLALAVNALCALVALATTVLYLGAYTPLKTRTTYSTAIGAIPGALPPLIGWAAARGSLSLGAWVLFGILFFWQFPHFMAIAWMYREDYARAGVRMLPVVDRKGDSTFRVVVCTSAILVWVSALPSVIGMAGMNYFFGALVLGMLPLQVGLWANRRRTNASAKWLMHATVAYIPLLLAWLILDRLAQ